MGGSLPHGCPDSIYSVVGAIAQKRGIRVILDAPVNVLRASLGGKFRPWLIKPNITELEELTRRRLGTEADILRAARALARKADILCVSLGAEGAYLVTGGKAWRGISPSVRARGTVGAGDSMVGALAFRLARPGFSSLPEAQLLDAFAWGLAAGAASAEAEGTAMAGKKRIAALRARVKIKPVY
jgi:fructose-1-phosphate kinase PfkB-like protein